MYLMVWRLEASSFCLVFYAEILRFGTDLNHGQTVLFL
jgi:hypothetical protein